MTSLKLSTTVALVAALIASSQCHAAPVTGEIKDAATGKIVPARLYIRNTASEWFFAESSSTNGAAIRYAKTNWANPLSVEVHTTLSAHPFHVELPPGDYTFTAERGKEFRPLEETVTVGTTPVTLTFELSRWINMAERDWFSGDGHVHRSLAELPTLVLAEDLNVALPQTYWAIEGFTAPIQSAKNGKMEIPSSLIRADNTHVIWPRNTEYEIYRFGEKTHNLGGVFILNHREPFTLGAPPMRPVAEEAHRQGALLDMDKHDWAWSFMLVPVMKIDLFELANNHIWRTEFGLTNFNQPAPAFMNLPNDGKHGSERDWMDYGFQSYYTLLNCDFRLRPTAGCASGVHPVPLGFGRVYVHCPRGFSYDAWIKGLGEGRSFVTTGPMLLAKINGDWPGGKFQLASGKTKTAKVSGTVLSEQPIRDVELIVNGQIAERIAVKPKQNRDGAWEAKFATKTKLTGTSWIAVRCWEARDGGRVRFAHTASSWFDVPGEPMSPRREEIAFLIERMKQQIELNREMLPAAALDDYRDALAAYEEIAKRAR